MTKAPSIQEWNEMLVVLQEFPNLLSYVLYKTLTKVWQVELEYRSELMEMEFVFSRGKEKEMMGKSESGPEKMPWEAQKFWKSESIIGYSHSRDFNEPISLSSTAERPSAVAHVLPLGSLVNGKTTSFAYSRLAILHLRMAMDAPVRSHPVYLKQFSSPSHLISHTYINNFDFTYEQFLNILFIHKKIFFFFVAVKKTCYFGERYYFTNRVTGI